MNETHAASPHTLSVGEVARRSGVAVSTLHFYESKGLISAGRNAGNQRRYARDVLRYIAIIKVAQRVGIPLETVKQSLSGLPKEHPVSAAEWQRLTRGWREELDERITKLQRLRDDLDSCIGCGCLSMKDCPLRNPDDVLGQQGPGARILEAPVGTKKRGAAACRLPDERGD